MGAYSCNICPLISLVAISAATLRDASVQQLQQSCCVLGAVRLQSFCGTAADKSMRAVCKQYAPDVQCMLQDATLPVVNFTLGQF